MPWDKQRSTSKGMFFVVAEHYFRIYPLRNQTSKIFCIHILPTLLFSKADKWVPCV